jgi:rare lipoprotein A
MGKPYTVAGKTYYPREDPSYRAVGVASWYGSAFHGRRTANGEVFNMHALERFGVARNRVI